MGFKRIVARSSNVERPPRDRLSDVLKEDIIAYLPMDRKEKSELVCGMEGVSIAAYAHNGKGRNQCDDSVVVVAKKDMIMSAVFDGFGDNGYRFARGIATALVGATYAAGTTRLSKQNLVQLLRNATSYAIPWLPQKDRESGTTAMVVILYPDGNFVSANIGDSALYQIYREGTRRFFRYNDVVTSEAIRQDVASLHVKPAEYAGIRHAIADALFIGGVAGEIETAEGVLAKGETLLLGSDGLTKGLWFRVNGDNDVVDISGCEDIAHLIGNVAGVDMAARLVMEAMDRRTITGPYMDAPGGFALVPADDDISVVVVTRS